MFKLNLHFWEVFWVLVQGASNWGGCQSILLHWDSQLKIVQTTFGWIERWSCLQNAFVSRKSENGLRTIWLMLDCKDAGWVAWIYTFSCRSFCVLVQKAQRALPYSTRSERKHYNSCDKRKGGKRKGLMTHCNCLTGWRQYTLFPCVTFDKDMSK